MKESTFGTAENQNNSIDHTVEYTGGAVGYSVIKGSRQHNPFIIVPGFTGGRTALKDFAFELNRESGDEVIFYDQPIVDKRYKKELSIVDQHAKALLSIIDGESLKDTPVNFITHSFGAMVAARAAELARVEGIKSFESKEGSHAVFISPAGSNDKENVFFLGGRWAKFIVKDTFYRNQLDPTGEMSKAGVKNFRNDPIKTTKEILELKKKSSIYSHIGNTGLKPFVLGYASDLMFPDKVIKGVIQENAEALAGYSVAVDSSGVGASSFQEFKQKTGLSGKAAKNTWAHHYRNADHADLQYHPDRTVKAVLQVINH